MYLNSVLNKHPIFIVISIIPLKNQRKIYLHICYLCDGQHSSLILGITPVMLVLKAKERRNLVHDHTQGCYC